jgi:hypothetical protein
VLRNLYSSQNIRMIKSRRVRLAGHVAHVGIEKCVQNFSQKTWMEEIT